MAGVLIVLGIAIVVGVAIYGSYYLKKKRRDETALMAKQLGLTFSPDDTEGLIGYPFQLFTRGDGRGCLNVMSGTWESMPLREFEYWYYDESTDEHGATQKSYYYFSCVLTGIQANCPALTIGHENVLTHMASHMGFTDIDFESEDFNREFRVKSPDKKFANDLIDARLMQWMLSMGKDFSYEVVGSELLAFSKRRKPSELIPLLGVARGFIEHLPRVVYELYGSGASR